MNEREKGLSKTKTISIIMPALNEEDNIEGALDSVVTVTERLFDDYEIIVVNDGSTDQTLDIVHESIRRNKKIRVLSHSSPRGFGASFDTGRGRAGMPYCVMVQGDNPFTCETLSEFFSHVGKADVICGYWKNPGERTKTRQLISTLYTKFLNALLRLDLKYYNGLQVHLTDWVKHVPIKSSGFGFQAEILVAAINDGKSYLQVPTAYVERPEGGVTKIFKLKNMLSVLRTISRLWLMRKKRASGNQKELGLSH